MSSTNHLGFTLRKNVNFQRRAFTAQSVKATMDYLKDPANKTPTPPTEADQGRPYRRRCHGALHHGRPLPSLIDRASLTAFIVMPAGAQGAGAEASHRSPIGTAPSSFEWKRASGWCSSAIPTLGRAGTEPRDLPLHPRSSRHGRLTLVEMRHMKDLPPHAIEVVTRAAAKVPRWVSSRSTTWPS